MDKSGVNSVRQAEGPLEIRAKAGSGRYERYARIRIGPGQCAGVQTSEVGVNRRRQRPWYRMSEVCDKQEVWVKIGDKNKFGVKISCRKPRRKRAEPRPLCEDKDESNHIKRFNRS
ncbi:hypothetical protein J6590_087540 [Homalodisca vitripennis]|nr:hypothetical protein J6590_087540 [Homalodisca vitripennis]